MSVIPTVYNQGTGLIGSTTSGAAIPSNIDDLIVNDTLLVGGEATFNGAVTINNTLTVSGVLTFQDVTVQGTFILEGKTPTQLAFYTTGGELTGTADMTYSGGVTTMTNVTVTSALSFGALTKTDPNNYAVALHDNNRICIAGSPNVLTYNPSTGNLATLKLTVGDDLIVAQDLNVTFGDVTLTTGDLTMTSGTLTANAVSADFIRIQPLPSGNTDDNVPILFCDTGDNNTLKQDTEPVRLSYTPSLNKFFTGNAEINSKLDVLGDCEVQNDIIVRYNPGAGETQIPLYDKGTGTVYSPRLEIFGTAFINLTSFSNDQDYGVVLFNTSTTEFGKETVSNQLKYNPFTNIFTARNIAADVSIISGLPTTNDASEHTCFFQNPAGTNQNRFEKDADSSHFTYNPGEGRLTVYKLQVTDSASITGLTVTPVTKNDGTDYPVIFYDATASQICVDTDSTKFTYNPLDNKLTVDDMLINTKCVVNTEARSNDYEYRFVLQDQATFQLVRDSALLTMTYNPLEERFTCENVNPTKIRFITGQIFNHVTFVYMGLKAISNNGTDLTGLDYNIALWNDGHVRVLGRNNIRLRIYNPQLGTETERLNITDSQIVANATLALTATGADTGTINVDPTLYLVYSHQTGHTFRIGGNGKLRLFNTSTVIYEKLLLQTVAVPTASASLPILLHNSSNEVEKTNVSGTNQITIDPSQGLLTTKDIYVNGSIYNNVLALNYTTVYSCDTWSCSLGTPPYFGNNNYIERDTDNTNFTNPRVSQYGQDIVNSINNTEIRSAIDFQTDGTYWGIATDDYKGWWYVDAALVYQNTLTGSNDRVVPYIRIIKSSGGLDIEQRQISKGIQYMRFTQGELSTIRCQGPVYLANTNQYLRICTLLEIGNIPSGGGTGEPTWPDTTTGFRGLDISIAMRFLGVSASDNETVNAL